MEESLTLEQQGEAAQEFLAGLVREFGLDATVGFSEVDEDTVQVSASGDDLGLLVGPAGATLAAVQDLTRTFVQRQSENRTDRILVDVGGYREKRNAALTPVRRGDRRGGQEQRGGACPRADVARRPEGDPRHGQRDRRGGDPIGRRGAVAVRGDRPGLTFSWLGAVTTWHGSARCHGRVPGRKRGQEPAPAWESEDMSTTGPGRTYSEQLRRRVEPDVRLALARSFELGFLGSMPIADQIDHALGFVAVVEESPGGRTGGVIDLGTGGGVPGLVLVRAGPDARIVLMDASERRTEFLVEVLDGWEGGGRGRGRQGPGRGVGPEDRAA